MYGKCYNLEKLSFLLILIVLGKCENTDFSSFLMLLTRRIIYFIIFNVSTILGKYVNYDFLFLKK